jgi:hypothetical protein
MLQPFLSLVDVSRSFAGRMRDDRGVGCGLVSGGAPRAPASSCRQVGCASNGWPVPPRCLDLRREGSATRGAPGRTSVGLPPADAFVHGVLQTQLPDHEPVQIGEPGRDEDVLGEAAVLRAERGLSGAKDDGSDAGARLRPRIAVLCEAASLRYGPCCDAVSACSAPPGGRF